jgi:hypothetical protein
MTDARVDPESESLESAKTELKLGDDVPPELPAVAVATVAQAALDGSELPAELKARTV